MTSGTFASVLVSSIWVDREGRQRRELTNIEELASSIRSVGLIEPIVVRNSDHKLIAGERRLAAVQLIGWTHIPVQYAEDLDEDVLQLIELEENVKRVDLPWQDRCQAVQRFHSLHQKIDPKWSIGQTANTLGIAERTAYEQLGVAVELTKGNVRVAAASKYNTARDVVRRDADRKRTQVLSTLSDEPPKKEVPIINANFFEWADQYEGEPFSLLHCDFPYGQGHGDSSQISGQALGKYSDTEDDYWALLAGLSTQQDKLLSPHAHIIFWFSMYYYQDTFDFLQEELGFTIEPFPLIWKKNAGTIPDPNRRPFRKYETAFFGWRGETKIVTAVDNIFDAAVTKEIHMSEKPLPMLKHFLRMVVDDTTSILDPTCGSGNALKAAKSLGAKRVLGIEKDPEFAARAIEAWDD